MAVEPIPFHIGTVSQAAAYALAGLTAVYALGTARFARRAFRAGLEDRWSAALATGVMAATAVLLWTHGATLLPAPFSVGVLGMAVAGVVITLTYTYGRYQERIDRFRNEFGARLQGLLEARLPEERLAELRRVQEKWRFGPEERRKAPHLMMGLFLLAYVGLGQLVLRGVWELAYGGPGDVGGEGITNLYLASHSGVLPAGHLFALFALLSLLYLLFPVEMLRLQYPELSYPFKEVIMSRLREKERGLFGAHYYIAATLPLAVMWLTLGPRDWDVTIFAVIALLLVTVFADTASALIGRRFGRRKWPHNSNKSYVGTAGGTLVAFVVALPFVGLPVAVVSCAVFLAVDLLAPVPFPASDNLLNPLGLAFAYWTMQPWLAPMVPYY